VILGNHLGKYLVEEVQLAIFGFKHEQHPRQIDSGSIVQFIGYLFWNEGLDSCGGACFSVKMADFSRDIVLLGY